MLFIDLENNSNDKTMTNSNTSYIENDKVSILVLLTLIMPVITQNLYIYVDKNTLWFY